MQLKDYQSGVLETLSKYLQVLGARREEAEEILQFQKSKGRDPHLADYCREPDYTDPRVLDGSGWHLEIQHAGRHLKTGGDNGYPGPDGPEYSPETAFGQFLAALEQLTGLTEIL